VTWSIEPSAIGRLLIPPAIPSGFGLFYTSVDFSGRLGAGPAEQVIAAMRERFGVGQRLASCHQVHEARVVRAREEGALWEECSDCDALFTDAGGIALGIKVADCLPVTAIDPTHRVIVNIHSGWRGTAAGIVSKTLDELEAQTSFDASGSLAWLGPAIRSCCFEVGEEVVGQLKATYGKIDRFVDRTRGPRPFVDTVGLTRESLLEGGFHPDSIHDSGLCTRCEGSIFHSWRRDRERSGRNLAVVAS